MSPELLSTSKKLFLETMLNEIDKKICELYAEYKQDFENNEEYVNRLLLAETIARWKIQRKRVNAELRMLDGNSYENDGKLDIAKERKFEEFLEVKKNKARCPFHKDKTPSFSIKGNKGHCFSCGFHGDIIDFIQKQHGFTFQQAINFLS
jgi:hypothetical protein